MSKWNHSNITLASWISFHISWLVKEPQTYRIFSLSLVVFRAKTICDPWPTRFAPFCNVGGKTGACVVLTPYGEMGKFVLHGRNLPGGLISVSLAFSLWIKVSVFTLIVVNNVRFSLFCTLCDKKKKIGLKKEPTPKTSLQSQKGDKLDKCSCYTSKTKPCSAYWLLNISLSDVGSSIFNRCRTPI